MGKTEFSSTAKNRTNTVSQVKKTTLPEKPSEIRKVKMNTAGRDLSMIGCVCDYSPLYLEARSFLRMFMLPKIQDDMFLGLDFMHFILHEVLVNIPDIRIGDIIIPMVKYDRNSKTAEVEVCKTTVLPHKTIVNVQCASENNLPSLIVKQLGIKQVHQYINYNTASRIFARVAPCGLCCQLLRLPGYSKQRTTTCASYRSGIDPSSATIIQILCSEASSV